jgi:hypothetical protein
VQGGLFSAREQLVFARTNGAGCGRQNRVVLAPVAGVKPAEIFVSPTGPDKIFNPPATVARRIRRRGERVISR